MCKIFQIRKKNENWVKKEILVHSPNVKDDILVIYG